MNLAPMEEDLFNEARRIEPAEGRIAYLDQACGSDPALRRRVEDLLRAHEGASRFLESPAAGITRDLDLAFDRALATPGMKIGPYELVEEIGEGGMGIVYLAQQREPVQRRVALKIIKPGMDTRQVITRFEAERQALALMDHPHIARILDGGATESGRPYFVMDLVSGMPITEYADAHRLSLTERLQLFVTVCRAVQHAHQKGIIHRDIKPSNILVTEQDGEPTPKIIDFGIAKAMRPESSDPFSATALGLVVGTPQYMSPEQTAPGEVDVDTRSDVYSLGVVLYELLTGTTPVPVEAFRNGGIELVRRLIREEESARPSDRLDTLADQRATIAERRGNHPQQLTRTLRGELDWIVMKSLEKDRNRRYESPAEVAADVQRYLRHEPVLAGPPSFGYRLRKLVRRHRVPVVAGLTVLLALVGGIVGTTIGMLRALKLERVASEERDRAIAAEGRAEAERAAAVAARNAEAAVRKDVEAAHRRTGAALDTLTDEVIVHAFGQQDEIGPRQQRFLQQIEQHYQALADARGNTEVSRANRAKGNLRVAQIRRKFGDMAGGERCARHAAALYQHLVADYPKELAYRRGLAGALHELATAVGGMGRHQEQAIACHAAMTIWQTLVQESPENDYNRQALAGVTHDLGMARLALRRYREAEESLREAVAARTRFVADRADSISDRRKLAGTIASLAILLTSAGRLDESTVAYRQSLEILNDLVTEFPGDPSLLSDRAGANRGLALVLYQNRRYADAERVLRAVIADRRKVAAHFPALPGYQSPLAHALRGLANVQRRLGRFAESEQVYRESVAIYAKLAEGPHATTEDAYYLSEAILGLGRVVNIQRRYPEAQQLMERAMATAQPAVVANPENYHYQRTWHRAMRWLVGVLAARGKHAEAADWAARVGDSNAAIARDVADSALRLMQCAWVVWSDRELPTDQKWQLSQAHIDRATRLFLQAGVKLIREAVGEPAAQNLEVDE